MITVLGEALVDRFEGADHPPFERPGGSPANVAVALARLGVTTRLATQLGDDERGRMVLRHLRQNGVAVAPGSMRGGRPTSVARTVVTNGQAEYDFSVTWEELPVTAQLTLIEGGTNCVHTGSIAALAPLAGQAGTGAGADSVRRAIVAARNRATVTFDPNCRPSIMGALGAVRLRTAALVAVSDVVKASEDDLRWLYADRSPRAVVSGWLDLGAALVVVTRGAGGSWAATREVAVAVPAEPIEVIDTVGAGDSFMAGLLAGLHDRGLLGAEARTGLRRLDADTLAGLLRIATQVAAVTCGRRGADSPTADELAASSS